MDRVLTDIPVSDRMTISQKEYLQLVITMAAGFAGADHIYSNQIEDRAIEKVDEILHMLGFRVKEV